MAHRILYFLLAVSAIGIADSADAADPAPNPMEITVGNGPAAGTYKPPGSETICMRVGGKILAASYKDFNPSTPKGLNEAGISISNPDDAGAKTGEVLLVFGDPEKSPLTYTLNIPADSDGPLTMTKNAKGYDLTFHGKAKDGSEISIKIACVDIEEI